MVAIRKHRLWQGIPLLSCTHNECFPKAFCAYGWDVHHVPVANENGAELVRFKNRIMKPVKQMADGAEKFWSGDRAPEGVPLEGFLLGGPMTW